MDQRKLKGNKSRGCSGVAAGGNQIPPPFHSTLIQSFASRHCTCTDGSEGAGRGSMVSPNTEGLNKIDFCSAIALSSDSILNFLSNTHMIMANDDISENSHKLFLLLTFMRIYNFQKKCVTTFRPGKSPGQGEFELKKCCTAAALSANDGRVEFGCVQLGKRVKYFSIPVDNSKAGTLY